MIKFFRSIRKKLLSENSFSKYLIYAIGEIVLVVIGILIALAINNANQKYQEQKFESAMVARIHQEFYQNAEILMQRRKDIAESEQAARGLLDLMNSNIQPSQYRSIDSIIYQSIDYYKFIPSQVTVDELVQTGKIELITNESLRTGLLQWSVALMNFNNTHAMFEKWIEESILPYLTKNIALKNVDLFSEIGYEKGSAFENGYDQVFDSREYENILDNHLYHHTLVNNEYDALQAIINQIIELSKAE